MRRRSLGLNQRIAIDHPGLPIVLIGHSMGSFMAQHFISEHGQALSGVVLAGSNGKPARLTVAVRIIARIERLRMGPRGRSPLVHSLAFGTYNKQFEPVRTTPIGCRATRPRSTNTSPIRSAVSDPRFSCGSICWMPWAG